MLVFLYSFSETIGSWPQTYIHASYIASERVLFSFIAFFLQMHVRSLYLDQLYITVGILWVDVWSYFYPRNQWAAYAVAQMCQHRRFPVPAQGTPACRRGSAWHCGDALFTLFKHGFSFSLLSRNLMALTESRQAGHVHVRDFIRSSCHLVRQLRDHSVGGSPPLSSSSACTSLITATSLFTSHRLWIIQRSDFHMRTARRHENCLFLVFTLPHTTPPPPPPSSSVSLPCAPLLRCHRDNKDKEHNHVYMFYIREALGCANWGWVDVVMPKKQ